MAESTQLTLLAHCSICESLLPVTEFYADKRSSLGRRRDCRRCFILRGQRRLKDPERRKAYVQYQQAYREAHRAEACARTARYRAENPDRVRLAHERYRADPNNKRIARERARAFRIANPERRSEYERRRRAIFKESAVIGFVTPDGLAAKFDLWGNRCWMCGAGGDLHVDHVKPLAKGGAHVLANLRPACGPCNLRKSDRWPFPTTARVLTCSPSPSRASASFRTSPTT